MYIYIHTYTYLPTIYYHTIPTLLDFLAMYFSFGDTSSKISIYGNLRDKKTGRYIYICIHTCIYVSKYIHIDR